MGSVAGQRASRERDPGLAQRAYRSLRDDILSREIPPGARLSVPVIAQRLGVSRSPAREAITRIAHEGLATITPHRGAVVAAVEIVDLAEIYRIREVLEGLAGRLAAPRATEEGLARLRDLLEEHERAVADDDVECHYRLDAEFHAAIREMAGSPRLLASLEILQSQVRLAMHTTHHAPGGMVQAVREHGLILAALESGNADFAETAARLHIRRLITYLEGLLADEPGVAEETSRSSVSGPPTPTSGAARVSVVDQNPSEGS